MHCQARTLMNGLVAGPAKHQQVSALSNSTTRQRDKEMKLGLALGAADLASAD